MPMFFENLKILKGKNLFRDIKDRASPQGQHILYLLLIAIIGIAVYSNTFNVPFRFDDIDNIVENYKLRDLNNFWPPSGSRWFGFLTFALNYYFGGLNTFGYHIFNLIIHILNAILVYWLVVFTFRTPYFKVSVISASVSNQPNQFNLSTFKPLNYLPLFIALLFVSHPIQTQAVTYIVQRFTSLATMFYLLSLVMYIKARLEISERRAQSTEDKTSCHSCESRNPGTKDWIPVSTGMTDMSGKGLHKIFSLSPVLWYLGSVLSAILAMKTKEISFTLPVVITLYEFMFFEGKIKKRILYLIPFLLTMLIIPLSLIEIDKPIGDAIGELREAAQETEEISRWSYLFTQFRIIVTYIRLLFLPINQNLDYDYPIYHSFFNPEVFLSLLFLLLIFAFGLYLFYRSRISHPEPKAKGLRDSSATPQTRPERKACPEHERRNEILTLNQVQGQNDRKRRNDIKIPTSYTLSPTPYPLYATRLIAFGILWFFITLSVESSIIPIRDVIFEHRVYLPSVGAVIAFSTAVFRVFHRATEQQSNRVVVKGKTAVLLHYCSAALIVIALSIATYQRNTVWQDEMSLWKDVIKKSPNKARGHNNLGGAYQSMGLTDKAIEHCHIALRLKPDYVEAYYNLGIAYHDQGHLDEAIQAYHIALRLKPDFVEAHYNLGMAYHEQGHLDEAIQAYHIALRLKPDYVEAYNNLGVGYSKQGRLDEAIQAFQTALRLKPDFVEAHYNLGMAYEEKGLIDDAMMAYQNAIRLNPDYANAHNNLGVVYEKKGLLDEAIKEYEMALRLRLNPSDIIARNNLNRILHIKNK